MQKYAVFLTGQAGKIMHESLLKLVKQDGQASIMARKDQMKARMRKLQL
jgi:hypothetical protein